MKLIEDHGHNKSGYCKNCVKLFVSYPESAKIKQSQTMKGRNRWNIHRNQKSYAEKFFELVLTNNRISFEREKQIKKDKEFHCYYLDFLIDGWLDLEIDGKQHKQIERKESDLIRDEFLRKQGYFVYRIAWNEIKTEKGKQMIQDKIDLFLKFYDKWN